MPSSVETIAESLGRAGYRTGAITDGGLVSQVHGFGEGFQWFDEEHTTLEATLSRARSFLDAADGRPTFLFVQTYYTHAPYEVSEETRASREFAFSVSFWSC